ncbi:MAG: UDP-N-acetylmuramate dehydrogenase [Patescibacteria group bacterium]
MRQNVSLRNLNTYGVGGSAAYFTEARTGDEMRLAVMFAREKGLRYFILGGGTNTLVSDEGFSGVVIRAMPGAIAVEGNMLVSDAGVPMGVLVQKAKTLSLTGLEWAAGLPGTLGGAVFGNAGSCGKETKDVVAEVRVYDPERGVFLTIPRDACAFAYRSSMFKSNGSIIVGATLALTPGNPEEIAVRMQENMRFRASHQPLSGRSEGCVFKNVELAHSPEGRELVSRDECCGQFRDAAFLPAGFLIDRAGLKGCAVGGAQVSERHANFVVNGGATARDIRELITHVKRTVEDTYGVALVEEIRMLRNYE